MTVSENSEISENLRSGRVFALTVAYDGTRLAGWQRQPNGRAVQAILEDALLPLLGERVTVVGSGRTDAGVHALGQVASFVTTSDRSAAVIGRALSASLPYDVRLVSLAERTDDFHALRDATGKHYRYLIDDGPIAELFLRSYVWRVRQRLDLAAMRNAAAHLVGEHDFASFQSAGSPRKTTVRTVTHLTVRRTGLAAPLEPSAWIGPGGAGQGRAGQGGAVEGDGPLIAVDVAATGFLYNMVRNIVGTLVEVGRGRLAPDAMPAILAAQDRRAAGPTAPPEGLILVAVAYDDAPPA